MTFIVKVTLQLLLNGTFIIITCSEDHYYIVIITITLRITTFYLLSSEDDVVIITRKKMECHIRSYVPDRCMGHGHKFPVMIGA